MVPAQRARSGPLTGLDVNSDVFKAIASYQPFNLSAHQAKLENHPLYQLAELSNEDKHRTILTRAACHRATTDQTPPAVEFTGVDIRFVGQATFVYDRPLGTGDVFLRGTFTVTGPNPQVLISGSLLTDLAFGADLTTTDGHEAIRRAVWGICNTLPTLCGLGQT